MHWLTKASLQFGAYSFISFLTFVGSLAPVTRIGTTIIVLGFFVYLLSATYKDYVQNLQEMDSQSAKRSAISENSSDLILFVVFLLIGLCLAFY